MISSLHLQHFRGFEDTTVLPLTRVNLLVGENTTGKAAVLEALLMLLDDGGNGVTTESAFRSSPGRNEDRFDSFWKWVFYNRDSSQGPQVCLRTPSEQEFLWRVVSTTKVNAREIGTGFFSSDKRVQGIDVKPGGRFRCPEHESWIKIRVHYAAMETIWKGLIEIAAAEGIQVVATTHSRECIEAAHSAMAGRPEYELTVHRLQNIKGKIESVAHDREMVKASFVSGIAIR